MHYVELECVLLMGVESRDKRICVNFDIISSRRVSFCATFVIISSVISLPLSPHLDRKKQVMNNEQRASEMYDFIHQHQLK